MKAPNTKAPAPTDQAVATDFAFPVQLRLSRRDIDLARKAINLAIVGAENCNKDVNGKITPAFPEHDAELRDAHHKMNMTTQVTVLADLTRGGNWVNLRIKG
jgi:hypothetical protein